MQIDHINQLRRPGAARADLIDETTRAERSLRTLASRWPNPMTPRDRWRLLRIANRLEKLLLREGKR